MRKPLICLKASLLLVWFSLFAGCGRPDAAAAFASHSDLFSSGQLKEDWDIAMTAMKTNGYVTAETTLNKMRTENPTAEQLNAINHAIKAINDQLYAAAEKGDANASKALKELANSGHSQVR